MRQKFFSNGVTVTPLHTLSEIQKNNRLHIINTHNQGAVFTTEAEQERYLFLIYPQFSNFTPSLNTQNPTQYVNRKSRTIQLSKLDLYFDISADTNTLQL